MRFPRGLLFGVTALLLCAAALAEEAADDLRKRIPGSGIVYGEFSSLMLENSPLFVRLSEKYPAFKQFLDKGRGQFGGYDGKLDRIVIMYRDGVQESRGFAVLVGFTRPFDRQKVLASLGRQEMYETTTIGGQTACIMRTDNPLFGRTCAVFVSDRTFLLCPEADAGEMLKGAKLSAALAEKLRTGANGVFLRIIPGPAPLPPEANVRDYELTGILHADSSLGIASRVEMPDEEKAKTLELQIRQGMMIGLGVLFADDSELGMDLMNLVKIRRAGAALTLDVKLSPEMIERLVEFGAAQAEKKRRENIERQKRREERRRAAQQKQQTAPQQTAPQQTAPQQTAPAASGTTSSR